MTPLCVPEPFHVHGIEQKTCSGWRRVNAKLEGMARVGTPPSRNQPPLSVAVGSSSHGLLDLTRWRHLARGSCPEIMTRNTNHISHAGLQECPSSTLRFLSLSLSPRSFPRLSAPFAAVARRSQHTRASRCGTCAYKRTTGVYFKTCHFFKIKRWRKPPTSHTSVFPSSCALFLQLLRQRTCDGWKDYTQPLQCSLVYSFNLSGGRGDARAGQEENDMVGPGHLESNHGVAPLQGDGVRWGLG